MGAIQRPGNEVVDKALPWLDQHRHARVLRLDASLRRACAVRAAGAVQSRAIADDPYSGEIAFADAQVGRVVAVPPRSRSLRSDDRRRHGRSRREPAGSRRGDARLLRLREHRARAADHPRAVLVRCAAAAASPTSCAVDRRDADRARDARRARRRCGDRRRQRRSADDGRATELGLEAYSEAMYPLHHFGWSDLRAMRQGRYKLIAAPRPELYDLQDDPGSSTTSLPRADRSATGCSGGCASARATSAGAAQASAQPVEVDPDASARLAALGYVGSFVTTAAPTRRAPDWPIRRTRSASSTKSRAPARSGERRRRASTRSSRC